MKQVDVAKLAGLWRNRARLFEDHGATAAAQTLTKVADELEETLQRRSNELLNLQEGAELSGYTADHLGALVREGTIPNAGRPNAPKIRRGDLPRKPGHRLSSGEGFLTVTSTSRKQVVRSIANRMEVDDG